MNPRYSADTSQVRQLGDALQKEAQHLQDARQYGAATGAEPYEAVTDAVADFCNKWDNALTRLTTSMGDLGKTTADAAVTYEQHDQQWGQFWAGK